MFGLGRAPGGSRCDRARFIGRDGCESAPSRAE